MIKSKIPVTLSLSKDNTLTIKNKEALRRGFDRLSLTKHLLKSQCQPDKTFTQISMSA
ncbi:MAG: hypothetical protein ACJARZ_002119 [Dokdonia sp.]|jgi:hypothetical protein